MPTAMTKRELTAQSQMQINLEGLLKTGDSITTLHNTRCGRAALKLG